jgi:hypothetical protein
VIQLTVIGALVAVSGGAMAVAFRDSRLVAIGLFVAMVAAPLVSSPEPTYTTLAFRFLGSLLAAYLLWAAARALSISSAGSAIGAASVIGLAAAAFLVGWYVMPVKPMPGPLAAQAGGFALIALAVGPLAGRNVLRTGTGLALLALGINMLTAAWAVPASSLNQIVMTAVVVGIAGATSLLISPAEATVDETGGVVVDTGAVQIAAAAETPGDADPAAVAAAAVPEPEPQAAAATPPGRARRLGVREPRR